MNKTNKRNILISSILAIMLCVSLIAGATFALFTSESKVNIAVTSGKVDVVATVENLTTYSGTDLTGDVTADAEKIVATATNGEFTNGGTAVFSSAGGNVITLSNVTPGDKVTFDVKIVNNSNVAVMYRIAVNCEDDNGLFYGLEVKIDDEKMTSRTLRTEYTNLAVGSADIVVPISIELPSNAGNEYQDKTCKISYAVEAAQGNAFNGVYNVTPATVQDALDKATDGDVINLGEGDYGTLYFRQSAKSSTYASGATGADLVFVNGEKITYSYHPGRTDITYMRTLKNITIVGSENANVDNVVFMDGSYKYAEDSTEISGNIIYSDENTVENHGTDTDYENRLISLFTIKNLTFKNIKFTGANTAVSLSKYSVDTGLSALVYRYTIDGLHFDGCEMTVTETTTTDRMLLRIVADSDIANLYKNISIENCSISADRVLVVDGVENLSVVNNTFKNIKNRDLNFSQGGSSKSVAGNVIISGNTSDGGTERFIRIGDATQMNLVITGNTITNYAGGDSDYIKVTGTPLTKTVMGNTATAADGRTLTVNIA